MSFETQVDQINSLGDRFFQYSQQVDADLTKLYNAKTRSEAAAAKTEALLAGVQANPPGSGTGGGTTPPTSGDPLMAGAVYAGNTFDPVAYRTRAASMGDADGVAYLYGPGPAFYGTTGDDDRPDLYQNPDRSGNEISKQLNPNDQFARGCNLGSCGSFQLTGGTPSPNEAGMYSSNMGQMIGIPTNRNAGTAYGMGVTDYCTYETGSNVVQTKAELPWQYYGGGPNARSHVIYRDAGKDITYPVAIGRGEGRPGWNISNVIVHRNGLCTIDGAINGSNQATCQLRAGLVPTFVTQLNSNEFAFVTCWDTVNLKGYVVVIALAGTPQGGYLGTDPANWDTYRGEWRGCFPGMPSYGNISFMKIVGEIELPGMRCPTGVAASTFHYWGNYTGLQDNNGRGFDLRNAAHRDILRRTKYFCFPNSASMVVISKEEKKACFIDLGPMIKYYRDAYMVEPGVGTVGLNNGQFPLRFDEQPTQKPIIIKTVDYDQRLTYCKMSRFDKNKRCYIATQDGTIRVIDMGVYPISGGAQQNAASIAQVASIPCGRNPTCIALPIRHSGAAGREGSSGELAGDNGYFGHRFYKNADFTRHLIVCSRGDRKIQWIEHDANWNSGSVVFTIMDKKLKDPIWCGDEENHTTEHYNLTCADHEGMQVITYNYANHIWWDSKGFMNDGGDNIPYDWGPAGLAPDGFVPRPTTFFGTVYRVECGGRTPFYGKPVMGGFANVY